MVIPKQPKARTVCLENIKTNVTACHTVESKKMSDDWLG